MWSVWHICPRPWTWMLKRFPVFTSCPKVDTMTAGYNHHHTLSAWNRTHSIAMCLVISLKHFQDFQSIPISGSTFFQNAHWLHWKAARVSTSQFHITTSDSECLRKIQLFYFLSQCYCDWNQNSSSSAVVEWEGGMKVGDLRLTSGVKVWSFSASVKQCSLGFRLCF